MTDFNAAIIEEFRANQGQVGGWFEGGRLLLITTTGARSGKPHTTPVGYLPNEDGSLLIIASAGGSPKHPAWFHNLRANPQVTVEDGLATFPATATVLIGEERDLAWERAVESDSGWAEYQEKAGRTIPMIRLVSAPGLHGANSLTEMLLLVHGYFRRELRLIRAEFARAGNTLTAQLKINCLNLCAGLHHHHTGEDNGLFPGLPLPPEVLDRLQVEHAAIGKLLTELQEATSLSTVDRLAAELEAHLDYEEAQILPLLS
ncbi:nitroreductase family deazaflavin-dependent oxidoreductase [Pseudonocardiaceae bacterium YIM PH 21723]|nr:nitroreductase family deazaflavin-dependent oxidoreductase [Pseudonocardiaceae bacterium YIM PH 21723]